MSKDKLVVYIVSDSLGETAEFVARAVVTQFNGGKAEYRRIPYVSDKQHLKEILDEASEYNSIVAYTLVVEELKEFLEEEAKKRNLPTVDMLGPMMEVVKQVTGYEPRQEPGLLHKLDENYFRKVEAVEFAVKYDDGKDPRGILHADIILIGVSRTSKNSPLYVFSP